MNKQLTVAFSIAILLTVTVVASIDLSQTADATKAKGTTTQKYGSATKSHVCGDNLCSEFPPEEKMNQKMQSSQQVQMKMDMTMSNKEMMKQKHLQMLEDMKSMSKSEIMDSMKTIMSEHKTMMIEKMSQMDRQDLLEHMDKMIDKMNKMDTKHMDMQKHQNMKPLYNEALNPRQIDYPNTLGFNDLHIHAIRHLDVEKSNGHVDHLLQTIVHHHCKVYDDMTAACLLFPYGMTDQDKPYGIEYVITSDQYQELPDEEKQYWHYHKTEFPRAQATFPELTDDELAELQPILDETYGKVYYFWNYGDKYPMGEPYVLVVQDIPDQ
jgi:hypothetical protein